MILYFGQPLLLSGIAGVGEIKCGPPTSNSRGVTWKRTPPESNVDTKLIGMTRLHSSSVGALLGRCHLFRFALYWIHLPKSGLGKLVDCPNHTALPPYI